MNTFIRTNHSKVFASVLNTFFKNPGSWIFLTPKAFDKLINNCLFFEELEKNSHSFITELNTNEHIEIEIFVQTSTLLYNTVYWIHTIRINDTFYKYRVPLPTNIIFIDSADA